MQVRVAVSNCLADCFIRHVDTWESWRQSRFVHQDCNITDATYSGDEENDPLGYRARMAVSTARLDEFSPDVLGFVEWQEGSQGDELCRLLGEEYRFTDPGMCRRYGEDVPVGMVIAYKHQVLTLCTVRCVEDTMSLHAEFQLKGERELPLDVILHHNKPLWVDGGGQQWKTVLDYAERTGKGRILLMGDFNAEYRALQDFEDPVAFVNPWPNDRDCPTYFPPHKNCFRPRRWDHILVSSDFGGTITERWNAWRRPRGGDGVDGRDHLVETVGSDHAAIGVTIEFELYHHEHPHRRTVDIPRHAMGLLRGNSNIKWLRTALGVDINTDRLRVKITGSPPRVERAEWCVQATAKLVESTYRAKLCVDALDFWRGDLRGGFDILRAKGRIRTLCEAARAQGMSVHAFFDNTYHSEETRGKWRARRRREMENQSKAILPSLHVLLGEMYASSGATAHYSSVCDNDDLLASHAHFSDNGIVLSGDGDFLRYTFKGAFPKYRIATSYTIKRGALEFRWRLPSPCEDRPRINCDISKPFESSPVAVDRQGGVQLLGAGHYMCRELGGNPYIRVAPLRRALYHKLGLRDGVRVLMPNLKADTGEFEWYEELETPLEDDRLLGYLDNDDPTEAFKAHFELVEDPRINLVHCVMIAYLHKQFKEGERTLLEGTRKLATGMNVPLDCDPRPQ